MINSELFLKKNSFSKCKILKIYLYKRSSELITEPKIIGVYTETGNLLILFNDFFKGGVSERYVGSAYILLNSLPYKDLDDVIEFNGNKVLMSSLFKEVYL